jgi:hypothetical protein
MSLTHQATVVLWFLTIPFGKFFHIIQRPASVGVTLYQQVNEDVEHAASAPVVEGGRCRRCGEALPSAQFIADLKGVLQDLGQSYALGDGAVLQDYCPTCKRVLRGQSYFELMGDRFL